MDSELLPIFVRLPTAGIVLLKSILESYDDLAIARTLDPEKGELVILALKDSEREVRELLESLETTLDLRLIPPPDSVCDDWLLKEELDSFRNP